jgi:hypothetical protein
MGTHMKTTIAIADAILGRARQPRAADVAGNACCSGEKRRAGLRCGGGGNRTWRPCGVADYRVLEFWTLLAERTFAAAVFLAVKREVSSLDAGPLPAKN